VVVNKEQKRSVVINVPIRTDSDIREREHEEARVGQKTKRGTGLHRWKVEGRADTPGSEELVSKRGFSFIIWNWFGFKKSYVEQQLTTCKVCKQIVPIKDSNTTNLFHHLKHKHKPDYEDSQKMRKDAEAALTSSKASGKEPTTQKLTNAFAHSTPSDHQSKQWKELTEAVAFCLVKDV